MDPLIDNSVSNIFENALDIFPSNYNLESLLLRMKLLPSYNDCW